MAQPMPQPMAQPGYAAPMQPMVQGQPMIPPAMMNTFILALVGSILLLIGAFYLFGGLCLVFLFLAVYTRTRIWATIAWIMALIGIIVAILIVIGYSLALAACSAIGLGYCNLVAGGLYLGIGLGVAAIVGGFLALLFGRKIEATLPAAVVAYAPMGQPMYQQPMQAPMYQQPAPQPMYQQPMQAPMYQQPMDQPQQAPAQQPVQPAPVAAVQPIAQPSSKFCKSCGQTVVAGAMFCPNCGSRY